MPQNRLRPAPAPAAGPYGQTGYPEVEKLIETEDFAEVNAAFEGAYAELVDVSKRRRGLKTQREAKKAMKALELTMDLFRELLAIKYRLQEEMDKRANAQDGH